MSLKTWLEVLCVKKLISFAMGGFIALLSFVATNISFDITANASNEDSLLNTLTCKQVQELHPAITSRIKNELVNMTEDISMDTHYKVSDKHIEDIFTSILCESPELFYVDPHILEVSVSRPDSTLISLRPTYLFTKEEVQIKQQELDDAANKIISGIGSDWTTMEKCRYVHDMIALNCQYYNADVETDDYSVYTAYGALVKGKAYCEGYTLAFNYIMKKLNIPTAYIQSIKVNQKDIRILEYNASVSHKIPIFAIQFLNTNEVWLMAKPEDFTDVAQYISTGKCDTRYEQLGIDLDNAREIKSVKINKVKSSSSARECFHRDREARYRKEKRAW